MERPRSSSGLLKAKMAKKDVSIFSFNIFELNIFLLPCSMNKTKKFLIQAFFLVLAYFYFEGYTLRYVSKSFNFSRASLRSSLPNISAYILN